MMRIVTIKFRTAGKHYDFNARDFELKTGDRVIVETDRGRALGSVVSDPVEYDPKDEKREFKSVLRLATEEDLQMAVTNSAREETAFRYCRSKISERQMEMKLVKAEYLFDGSKIIFYFTADGRVDFRELVKDLAHHFHTRIEMRQIGVRDEAKLIGGIGICGQSLCCCSFLTEFSPVSVKMAKEQQLALNPNKISGQCGRLLCCLGYEYETYCKMRKGMPKCGMKLSVEGINAQVSETDILGQKVAVRVADGRCVKMSKDEFKQLQESGGKLPEKKPDPALAEAETESRPAPEKKAKQEQQQSTDDKPKKRRRRRRKPGKKSESGQQQGGQKQQSGDKQGKPNPNKSDKPDSQKSQGKPEQKQQQQAGSQQPTGEKKSRRRRRPRRKTPKPDSSDKS